MTPRLRNAAAIDLIPWSVGSHCVAQERHRFLSGAEPLSDCQGWQAYGWCVAPYSPELNRVERVWLYLRERHLSNRVHVGYTEILDAVCHAWRQLTPDRLHALTGYPWLAKVRM